MLPSVRIADRKQLPKSPGIYFAVNANNEVLYIGKAVNLHKRWHRHHRYIELCSIEDIRLCWIETAEIDALEEAEETLIERFSPLLNDSPIQDETFKSQAQRKSKSVTSLTYHLTLSLQEPLSGAIEVELKQIIGETCKTYGWTLHSLEVMPDHVHLVCTA